ncbi:MAG: hypothetical protein NTU83_08115 [Candidatus Hydrogenedentes bacterium]|nr:hypothetical protein [Candidatus Hydrogenedentota bacterium]
MANCRLDANTQERVPRTPECVRWMREVERWVDGESSRPEEVAGHVAGCAACMAYENRLRTLRAGVAAVVRTETIGDTQFPAFMGGIRRGRVPRSGWRLSWRVLSVSMAVVLVLLAGSMYTYEYLNVPDPPVVESASTDIEDGAVTSYASDNGVTTVWVVSQDNDVW